MANFRAKVLQGLMSLKLCPAGKRLLDASIAPGGGGPSVLEPHLAECETCRKEVNALIERFADELGPK